MEFENLLQFSWMTLVGMSSSYFTLNCQEGQFPSANQQCQQKRKKTYVKSTARSFKRPKFMFLRCSVFSENFNNNNHSVVLTIALIIVLYPFFYPSESFSPHINEFLHDHKNYCLIHRVISRLPWSKYCARSKFGFIKKK